MHVKKNKHACKIVSTKHAKNTNKMNLNEVKQFIDLHLIVICTITYFYL